MPKDRIQETFTYLEARVDANELPRLVSRDVRDFKTLVTTDVANRTNGGALLSLDWSWYNTRPSKALRHAIRGYLLAALYNDDVLPTAVAAKAAATTVKSRTALWLHQATAEKIKNILGLGSDDTTRAAHYRLRAVGHDDQRAQATCVMNDRTLDQLMSEDMQHTAIVLIDMQATGDVGQRRFYGTDTVLQYQQRVLRNAALKNWIVYDIVIDPADANALGNRYDVDSAFKLKNLSVEERRTLVQRQRRPSYAESATTKTISVLRDRFPGARVRHIPKPTHPTFIGTLFGEHLEEDGIEKVIVMGYDANQCVKATVFGVPAERREEAERMPTGPEVERVMQLNPLLSVQQAQTRATPMKTVDVPYTPGLLDRGIEVITSRCVLASSYAPLDPEWARLSGRR